MQHLATIQPFLPLKECRAGPEIGDGRLLMLSTTILRFAATSRCKAKTKCREDSGYGSPFSFGGRVVGSFYIAVSGLSEEELCIILCPDGILLAAKVPRLCKGGDNVGNDSGFGWLVFMRGGRNDTDSELFMANKKFIHYNVDVYMPWIRELRKKLGWVEGQPVPESLKAVSCGATTISPSCKPCCSSLERQRT